ncbi:MAG TPA: FecR domain-containing protein [Chitinophagaceae bacterium]
MTQEEIKKLAERIDTGTATEEDILLYNRMFHAVATAGEEWQEDLYGNKAELERAMKAAIFERAGLRRPVVRTLWRRWAAAAAIVLLMGAGTYFLYSNPVTSEQPAAAAPAPANRFKNEVAPGQQGAILTLSSGESIVLDSTSDGVLAQEGAAEVFKQGGQVIYKGEKGSGEMLYHTMTTPRGRQYHLVLADGTRVWLNAASSITYPTAFTGTERTVSISGEVYFEVAHQAGKPFEVQKGDVRVQVLGTHFNVNAYEEESSLNVTLLEGAVRVVKGEKSSAIKPGQQAQVHTGDLQVVSGVNVDEVMAWKNGSFRFGGADIGSIMRQLARWYDVEIVYNKKIEDRFYAEIPRDTKLSDVLKALELTGEVRFGIEGRKIVIMP